MKKFTDLDPQRQKHLTIILRCLDLTIAALAKDCDTKEMEALRLTIISQATSEVSILNRYQIAKLVKNLDDIVVNPDS